MDAANYFEEAAHHNADGVVSLQKGDAVKAFQAFMTALTTLNKFRHHQLSERDPDFADPPLFCSSESRRHRCCKAISVPYLEDNGFYLYSNAIIFSRKPDIIDAGSKISSISSPMDNIAFCEAVSLFNLGLVYHQRGKHYGEDKTLIGALDLYEQSLATLLTIKTGNSHTVNVLKLAVMNNRIHILNEVADFSNAQKQVDDLLLQSVSALSAENNCTNLSFLTRVDIEHFLLNALVIRRFQTAPCA